MCAGREVYSDCEVKKQLEHDRFARTCNVMVVSQIMESVSSVHHGSVEIKIQDSKEIQIDLLVKKRSIGY
ncbi:MAG: YezD family protein [Nitrospiria bacterium]